MKEYLGDGAYVEFDGYGLILTAEDGLEATDRVYLEPEAYARLVAFVARLKEGPTSADSGARGDADSGDRKP